MLLLLDHVGNNKQLLTFYLEIFMIDFFLVFYIF